MTRNLGLLAAVVACLGLASAAHAKPSFGTFNGNSCSVGGCHDTKPGGMMQVTPTGLTTDLGTQLNGNMRGPLTTYVVAPGDTVTLSVDVLNGADKYAVQLKRLETSGQSVSLTNFMVWSEDNAASNVWTRQETTNPPYFTKDAGGDNGIPWAGATISYIFDLFIDPTTPADYYDLEFAVGALLNDVKVYGDEHFYLRVVPEPGTMLLMGLGLALVGYGHRKRSH